jgi:hypothetical protein
MLCASNPLGGTVDLGSDERGLGSIVVRRDAIPGLGHPRSFLPDVDLGRAPCGVLGQRPQRNTQDAPAGNRILVS